MPARIRRKVVIDHDEHPDFSWLEQDHYNPSHPDYQPIYRTAADMRAKRRPLDGEWYRNPDNHVALCMRVYELRHDADDWECVDSLGGIDFLRDSNDWRTGVFYSLQELKGCPYLKMLAREAKLR